MCRGCRWARRFDICFEEPVLARPRHGVEGVQTSDWEQRVDEEVDLRARLAEDTDGAALVPTMAVIQLLAGASPNTSSTDCRSPELAVARRNTKFAASPNRVPNVFESQSRVCISSDSHR